MIKILDQLESYHNLAYYQGYTDNVVYGDIFKQDDSGLRRERVGSIASPERFRKSRDNADPSFDGRERPDLYSKNFLYSERLARYKDFYRRGLANVNPERAGSGVKNLYTQTYSEESFFDSYVPSPIELSKINKVKFCYVAPGGGILDAAPNFGLPSTDQEVPIVLGDESYSHGGSEDDNIVDTLWISSPFPFQKKYQEAERVFNLSYVLPEKENLTVDFFNGDIVTPPSQSDVLGSVYFVEDVGVEANSDNFFPFDVKERELKDTLTLGLVDNESVVAVNAARVSTASLFGGIGVVHCAITNNGNVFIKYRNQPFIKEKEFSDYELVCVGHAAQTVTENFFWVNDPLWILGGRNKITDGPVIVALDKDYNETVFAVPTGTGAGGSITGVAASKIPQNDSGVRHSTTAVAVGKADAAGTSGFILRSQSYTNWGMNWDNVTPSGFAVDALHDVTFDRYTGKYWAVGNNGLILSSSDDKAHTWNIVHDDIGLIPIDYKCITTNDDGTIIAAGVGGVSFDRQILKIDIASDLSLSWINMESAETNVEQYNSAIYVPDTGDFILVGDVEKIQRLNLTEDPDTWHRVSPGTYEGVFYDANDGYGWGFSGNNYASLNADVYIAGQREEFAKDSLVFRTTDVTSDAYVDIYSEVDSSRLTYQISSHPTNGSIYNVPPNIRYSHNSGSVFTDSFQFVSTDGTNISAPATINVTIYEDLDPVPILQPVANNQIVSVEEGSSVSIILSGSTANTGYSWTYTVDDSGIANGTLAGSDNVFVYAPDHGFVGNESFTFTLNDGIYSGESLPATVDIVVYPAGTTPPDHPPTAHSRNVRVVRGSTVAITLDATDNDIPRFEKKIHSLATVGLGGVELPVGARFTRSTIADGLKVYYGYGRGYTISFDGSYIKEPTGRYDILRRRGVAYRDYKIVQIPDAVETVRLIGPMVQGFSYGVMNVVPQHAKAIWRRNRYGQFRDMLEQRPNAKYYYPPTDGDVTRYDSVVKVSFVSGTLDAERAKEYMESSEPVEFNWYDSGIYDSEYRSGQPFFDQRDK